MAYLAMLMTWLPKDDRGNASIEYGLLAALIAMAIIISVGTVGQALAVFFDDLATQLP
jgi:pilus assembly protein Flp/PilA